MTCPHTWTTRVTAMRLLREDGYPNGYYVAEETRTCDCCPAFETRGVPGTRSRSHVETLELYRKQQEVPA